MLEESAVLALVAQICSDPELAHQLTDHLLKIPADELINAYNAAQPALVPVAQDVWI